MPSPDSGQARNTIAGIVDAIAGEIPVVGAIVGSFTAVASARQRERDEEFFAMVVAKGAITEERVAAIARGEDDEFLATAYRIVREARETADTSRRQLLARVLANSNGWSTFSLDQRESLLPIVLGMTPLQVVALEYFADPRQWFETRGMPMRMHEGSEQRDGLLQDALGGPDDEKRQMVRIACEELSRKGLIDGSVRVQAAPGSHPKRRASSLGERVLSFIGRDDPSERQ
ncbi:hypothetical protein [Microbacterium sp. B35-30]|uniref:hypothetical protein n=1 Tax=Microbacterium sp. B35-30 TaxID=1962642 RepID=UPI0013D44304|nr:hypothetical protein [Microbacterium sp. B35-30]KAF2418096.1 hypothetical protein B2K11_09425 [Microbacterium sp. B35-30]